MSEQTNAKRLLRIARRVEQGYSRLEARELRDIVSTIQGARNAHDGLVAALEDAEQYLTVADDGGDIRQLTVPLSKPLGTIRAALAKAKGTST